jgi:hypothetical protein
VVGVNPLDVASGSCSTSSDSEGLAHGSNKSHSSKQFTDAVIVGVIAGVFVLLLLITLAVALIRRRRGPQCGGGQLSIWPIWSPSTPKLPMQMPPSAGFSPRSSFVSKQGYPRLDNGILEKGPGYPLPTGPDQNPFTDKAQVKPPPLSE